jgi:long-chain acyl-CoA synthetase
MGGRPKADQTAVFNIRFTPPKEVGMTAETLVSVFYGQAEAKPDHPILMVKREGRFRDVTFRELCERVRALAAGMKLLGIRKGDRVAMISENRQEFVEVDFATLTLGAITVAMHSSLSATQVRTQANDCDAKLLFVSTLAQRDKVETIRQQIHGLGEIYAFEGHAADGREVKEYAELLAAGRKALASDPHLLDESIASVRPEDVAAIIYTPGTAGEARGAMLMHRNFVSNVRMVQRLVTDPLSDFPINLAFLPQSHVFGRVADLYVGIAAARTLAICDELEHLAANIQEVKPHFIAAVPRVLDKLTATARHLMAEGRPNAIRELLGGRIQAVASGGAALTADVAQFLIQHDIPVYQGYGLTETGPIITSNSAQANRIGSVGKPIAPEIEVKIAGDGEILTRGPHVMKGYWNMPEATAAVIDSEGWFHTGDVGQIDEDGFLFITDRKKDIIVTAYGKNVAPQQIEALVSVEPLIEQVCVYGDGKRYLTALIVPNEHTVMHNAERLGMSHLAYEDILALPMTHDLFQHRIDQALCNLASHEQIKKFIVIPHPFKAEEGHVTVTARLRREQVIDRHRMELEALYLEDV